MSKLSPIYIRLFLLIGGGSLVLFALAADGFRAGSAVGFGQNQGLIMVSGMFMITLGLWLRVEDLSDWHTAGARLANLYQGVAVLLLNTLILIFLIEWLLAPAITRRLEFIAHPLLPSTRIPDDWENAFLQEFRASNHAQYQPYTVWRNVSFDGDLLKVNAQGLRETPGANCQDEAYRVFMLGGSALWGVGAPDWGTIPAYVQAGLKSRLNMPVCVINFGQKGYVSSQELIELTLQLQQGNIPDLVIFYDGSNEIWVASREDEVPNPHLDQTQIKLQVEQPLLGIITHSNTFGILTRLLEPNTQMKDSDLLTEQIVKTAQGTYQVVDALAKEYGFDFLCFWQPILFVGNKPLTASEQAIRQTGDLELQNLYQMVYEKMEAESSTMPYLHSLITIFDQTETDMYTDFVHILPQGNEMIAQAMLVKIAETLDE